MLHDFDELYHQLFQGIQKKQVHFIDQDNRYGIPCQGKRLLCGTISQSDNRIVIITIADCAEIIWFGFA